MDVFLRCSAIFNAATEDRSLHPLQALLVAADERSDF
jgi:hypothetical protein